jgi:hypothetical protein
LSELLL